MIDINLDYQFLTTMIGATALIVTLLLAIAGLLYKNMRSDLEKTKATIDAELKVLDQKYKTSEKIQKLELDTSERFKTLELSIERTNIESKAYIKQIWKRPKILSILSRMNQMILKQDKKK